MENACFIISVGSHKESKRILNLTGVEISRGSYKIIFRCEFLFLIWSTNQMQLKCKDADPY